MKSRREKISILFVPEGEGRSRNISLSRGTIRFLLICLLLFALFIVAGSVSYFFLSIKASQYDMTVEENLKLIEENRRIVKLSQDLDRLKAFNRQIRKAMGIQLNLDTAVVETELEMPFDNTVWEKQSFFGLNEPVFKLPIEGVLSRGYKNGVYPSVAHEGIDFAVKEGTIINASTGGWVIFSGYHYRYGNLLILQHPGDFITYYGHNRSSLVSLGEKVTAGQPIAISGNSGQSTAPHLHFEIRKRGTAVNPAIYLKELEPSINLTKAAVSDGEGE